jgi:DNA-binding XRE family transcriptional regulator
MTIINTRIKELRARYNLTQDDLADKVGVTRQTMLYLEKGKYNPSLVLAYKVAKALNSTIEEVFVIGEKYYLTFAFSHISTKNERKRLNFGLLTRCKPAAITLQ